MEYKKPLVRLIVFGGIFLVLLGCKASGLFSHAAESMGISPQTGAIINLALSGVGVVSFFLGISAFVAFNKAWMESNRRR